MISPCHETLNRRVHRTPLTSRVLERIHSPPWLHPSAKDPGNGRFGT